MKRLILVFLFMTYNIQASVLDEYRSADFSSYNIQSLNQLRMKLARAGRETKNLEMIKAAVRIENFIKIETQLSECELSATELEALRNQVAVSDLGNFSCHDMQRYLEGTIPGLDQITQLSQDIDDIAGEALKEEANNVESEIVKENRRRAVRSIAGMNYRFGKLEEIQDLNGVVDRVCEDCSDEEKEELKNIYADTIGELISQNAVRLSDQETTDMLNRQYIRPIQQSRSELIKIIQEGKFTNEEFQSINERRTVEEIEAEMSFIGEEAPEYVALKKERMEALRYQPVREAYQAYIQTYDDMMLSPAGALVPELAGEGIGTPLRMPEDFNVYKGGGSSQGKGRAHRHIVEVDKNHGEIEVGDIKRALNNSRDKIYDHVEDMVDDADDDPAMENIGKWTLGQPDIVGKVLLQKPDIASQMCDAISGAINDREQTEKRMRWLRTAGQAMDIVSLGLMLVPGVGVAARAAWMAARGIGGKLLTQGGKNLMMNGLRAGGAMAAAGTMAGAGANAMKLAQLREQEARMLALSGENAQFTQQQLRDIHKTISELKRAGIEIGLEVGLTVLASPASLERLSRLYKALKNNPALKAKYKELNAESEGAGDMFLAQMADGDVNPNQVNLNSVSSSKVKSVQSSINNCR